MPTVDAHPPGIFCWTELATSDADAARTFYTRLFGWEHHDDEVAPGMVYTMLMKGGKNAAALYGMNDEMKAAGVPPHWLSYVSVADVDASVARAESLGGKVVREAMDVMDLGRMAVLQDPTGAVFALWEARKAIGAQVLNEPGGVSWNELMTPDVDEAGSFYTKLFDWGADVMPMGEFKYTVFKRGDQSAGGMMAITPDMGQVPANWMIYFGVDDCDRTAKEARSLGATEIVPPTDIPDVGRFAVLQDPQGAPFAVLKLD